MRGVPRREGPTGPCPASPAYSDTSPEGARNPILCPAARRPILETPTAPGHIRCAELLTGAGWGTAWHGAISHLARALRTASNRLELHDPPAGSYWRTGGRRHGHMDMVVLVARAALRRGGGLVRDPAGTAQGRPALVKRFPPRARVGATWVIRLYDASSGAALVGTWLVCRGTHRHRLAKPAQAVWKAARRRGT